MTSDRDRAFYLEIEALTEAAAETLSRVQCPPLPHGDKAPVAVAGKRPPHPEIGGRAATWPAQLPHPGHDYSAIGAALDVTEKAHEAVTEAIKASSVPEPLQGFVRGVVTRRQARSTYPSASLEDDIAIAIRGADELAKRVNLRRDAFEKANPSSEKASA